MAATWRGAIEFTGFPVNIALHNRVKSRSGESFKMLAPNGQPVKQQYVDSDGNTIDYGECGRGIEVEKDKFKALSQEAIEQIKSGERSKLVEPLSFAPKHTLPLELAVASYAVTPDEKVDGSEKSCNVIWNGLRSTGLAYVTQVTVTAGSRDAILALWADDKGLWAAALPFGQELADTPVPAFTEDEQASQMFKLAVDKLYEVKPLDIDAYTSAPVGH
jgi:non-homologous end joining protein Ku